MSEWFCHIAGREIGPLTSHQLKEMAARGQILPSDRVRQGAMGGWVSASHVRGLFAETHTTPPPPPPPPTADADGAESDATPFGFVDEVVNFSSQHVADKYALARARRKRQHSILVATSLIFAVFGLGVVGILWLSGNLTGFAEIKDDVKKAGGLSNLSRKLQETVKKPAEEDKKEPSKQTDSTSSNAAKPRPPEPGDNLAEVPGLKMIVGDVPVRLMSIARGSDRKGLPESRCVVIAVEVKNPGRTMLDFAAWSRQADLRGATLTDDQGKKYPARPIEAASVLGKPPPTSIEPVEWVRDILAFELPGEKVQTLQLELPGTAFGKNATASFKIPANLMAAKLVVVRKWTGDESPGGPNAKKRSAPKPGTPEYDFGIGEDAAAPR
jgi:hypothetical protein